MKSLPQLVQSNPEIGASLPDFSSYFSALSANIFLAIVLSVLFVFLIIFMYYAICALIIAVSNANWSNKITHISPSDVNSLAENV